MPTGAAGNTRPWRKGKAGGKQARRSASARPRRGTTGCATRVRRAGLPEPPHRPLPGCVRRKRRVFPSRPWSDAIPGAPLGSSLLRGGWRDTLQPMGANGTGAAGLGWAGTGESVHGPTGGSGGHALACGSRVSSPRPERQGRWCALLQSPRPGAPPPGKARNRPGRPLAHARLAGLSSASSRVGVGRVFAPSRPSPKKCVPIAGLGSSFCFPRGCALLPRRREGRAGQESAHLAARHPLLSLCQTEMPGEEVQVSGQCASIRDWLSGEVTECLG